MRFIFNLFFFATDWNSHMDMETNSVNFFRKNNYQLPVGLEAPILVGWKLRTPENYGNMLRLADTVGCSKVVFVIDTIELADRKIRKTAGDSYQRMAMKFVKEEELSEHLPGNFTWVALETAEISENIFTVSLPRAMALFVGNEKKGISPQVLKQCQQIIHIPLTGKCTSLNVSHATAIALFEWVRQYLR